MSSTRRASVVSALVVALSVLATILVVLRGISRFIILKKACVDDYLSVIALVFAWAITAICLVGKKGVNRWS